MLFVIIHYRYHPYNGERDYGRLDIVQCNPSTCYAVYVARTRTNGLASVSTSSAIAVSEELLVILVR